MKELVSAKPCELQICMDIINDGRRFQKEQGFLQWTDEYPNLEILKRDIEIGKGYLLKIDGENVGYMCIDFDGEPAYDDIPGKWRTDGAYAVVHRMAFKRECTGKGLADTAFGLIEKLCTENGVFCIRVDTDPENKRMQHVLKRQGFESCGVIVFQGSGKLAFDKIL